MAMTGQLASIGRSSSVTPKSAGAASGTWKALKRQRSKSELPRTCGKLSAKPGLFELMSHYGGPPMPTLASPMQERPTAEKRSDDDDEGDEDEDGMSIGEGVKMDFKVRVDNIIPSFEGFKTHAYQLNRQLEPFLLERISQEQVRRYKKLVENKVKHAQAVHGTKRCSSGKHCFELGGEAGVAAGPVGREAAASTDARLSAGILSYSRTRGAYIGAAVKGAFITPDNDLNQAVYSKKANELFGTAPIAMTDMPADVRIFPRTLGRYSTK